MPHFLSKVVSVNLNNFDNALFGPSDVFQFLFGVVTLKTDIKKIHEQIR